jgi:hypothetical protein
VLDVLRSVLGDYSSLFSSLEESAPMFHCSQLVLVGLLRCAQHLKRDSMSRMSYKVGREEELKSFEGKKHILRYGSC